MPLPVNQNTPLATPYGHYDPEQGLCLGGDFAPANSSKAHTTEQPRSNSEATEHAGVFENREPNAASHACFVPVFEAGLVCGATAAAVASSTPAGPAALVAIALGGAQCGLKVMSAIDCLDT